ncbi:DUF4296 domain-containing protein [Mucilaginibacter psychrotolerans]|uniref:DUF4296 domain-containing protein n=1 Tax=Mucilaginibacter psychrotolerans TaxID=1524096 RepID=A0A4Y8S9C6_9SPHI|nr:DUF4296 domain-containing protein [Mucilaginibacter psychrotolerans]TFF35629.1 DUF4296 domain-containing protein [Mucilaginibacter psychrotolerans]
MHKYIILFFSVLMLFAACSGNNAPEGTIAEEPMISLLTDVHLTDGSLYSVSQTPDSLYKYGSARYKALFKRHHTTDKQFKASLKYYTTQPVKMLEMYDRVSANIQAKIDSLNKKGRSNTAPGNKNAIPVK